MRTSKPLSQEDQRMLDEHNCSIAYAVTVGLIMVILLIIVFGPVVIINLWP